jgi:hypothetical protein
VAGHDCSGVGPDRRLTQLEFVSVTSDTQTIGALAGVQAATKKLVTAMHIVNPSIAIERAEPTGVA